MKYATQDAFAGVMGLGDYFVVDTTPRFKLGQSNRAIDPDGAWGSAEFVYGLAGGTIAAHSAVSPTASFTYVANPTTANTGSPMAFSLADMTVGEYGWFQTEGLLVALTAASVAVGVPIGISSTVAGSLNTNSAGRQVMGAKVIQPSTYTAVSQGQIIAPTRTITLQDATEFFVGGLVTGTGIAATTKIVEIDVNNRQITVDKDTTTTGTAAVTITYTGYVKLFVRAPSMQGAIT